MKKAFAVIILWSLGAFAEAIQINPESYRIFCGYLDAASTPRLKDLPANRRGKKIAKMAKISPRKLKQHISNWSVDHDTCESVGKRFEDAARLALDKEMRGQIEFFGLDYSDPSHVVAKVTWKSASKQRLFEEASRAAHLIHLSAPIAKTIALRATGIHYGQALGARPAPIWFEGKISHNRVKHIQKSRISQFARTRYARLFDGVVKK